MRNKNYFGHITPQSWEIKALKDALAQSVNATVTTLALSAEGAVLQELFWPEMIK